jgi:hypothetical protein
MARSLLPPLNRQVALVQRRLFLQTLLDTLIVAWFAALLLGAGWFLLQPWLFMEPSPSLRWNLLGGLLGLATVIGLGIAWFRTPGLLHSALSLDERFKLKERVVTGLMLTPEEAASPAGQALLEDVNQRVLRLPVGDKFPVRLPKTAALLPLGAGLLLLVAVFYNPQFGQAQEEEKKPLTTNLADAKNLEEQLKQLQKKPQPRKAERARSKELEKIDDERDKLARAKTDTREEAKEVVKQLGTLEEQIQKRDKELTRRADALKEQMRQAEKEANKPQKAGPAQEMKKALNEGDLKKAEKEAEMIAKELKAQEEADRLRKKLEDPKLSKEEKEKVQKELDKLEGQKLTKEQKEQLQEQLKDLQDKLERLSRDNKKREQELRDKLAKGEITPEQLEREMNEMIDPQTMKQLKDLADKLGKCQKCLGEGKDGEAGKILDEVADELGKLDPSGEQKELARKLAELQDLRQGLCQCLDGKPVPAWGRRPEAKEHDTQAQDQRSRTEFGKGSKNITDLVKGEGVKTPGGQAELTEDVRPAAEAAADALDRQRLPRSASDMAKGYFEKLRGPDKNKKP